MLGRGCPWQNQCQKYKEECRRYACVSQYRKDYCENSVGHERCPEKPGNYYRRDQLQKEVDAKNQGACLGCLFLIAVIVFIFIKFG